MLLRVAVAALLLRSKGCFLHLRALSGCFLDFLDFFRRQILAVRTVQYNREKRVQLKLKLKLEERARGDTVRTLNDVQCESFLQYDFTFTTSTYLTSPHLTLPLTLQDHIYSTTYMTF